MSPAVRYLVVPRSIWDAMVDSDQKPKYEIPCRQIMGFLEPWYIGGEGEIFDSKRAAIERAMASQRIVVRELDRRCHQGLVIYETVFRGHS